MYIYVFMGIHTHIHAYIYTYKHIYTRETERERDTPFLRWGEMRKKTSFEDIVYYYSYNSCMFMVEKCSWV